MQAATAAARAELVKAQAQAERDEARQQARAAREDAAKLAGKLEAMQSQIASSARACAFISPQ